MAASTRNNKLSKLFCSICRQSQTSRRVHTTTRLRDAKVTRETIGAITVIGINRPEKKNAINRETADELREHFRAFERNSSERVAVLYGHGGTFCAGYDLAEVKNATSENIQQIMQMKDGPMGPSRMFLKKPVIASIEGYAVAGGLELALMCDMRLADESAILGVFCRRYGVPLIDGGTVRLPTLIGLSRALDLILTGREVSAREAVEIGLVNRVFQTGTVLGQAMKLADSLSKHPQVCLNADRLSTYNAAYSGKQLSECLEDEAKYGIEALKDLLQNGMRDALKKYTKSNPD